MFSRNKLNNDSNDKLTTLQCRLIQFDNNLSIYKKQKKSTSTPNLGPPLLNKLVLENYCCVFDNNNIESNQNIAKILNKSEIVKFIINPLF